MRVRVWIAVLAAVFPGAVLAQQKLPPGMTMHRQQAGALDSSGWALAESTRGKFSVKLPCAFNDFTIDDTSGADVTHTHTVGCLTPGREKYSATKVQYRVDSMAKGYFEKNASPGAFAGAKKTRTTVEGLPAIDFALPERDRCAAMRFVLAGPAIIMMVAESAAAQCAHLGSQVPVFFSSLKVQQ